MLSLGAVVALTAGLALPSPAFAPDGEKQLLPGQTESFRTMEDDVERDLPVTQKGLIETPVSPRFEGPATTRTRDEGLPTYQRRLEGWSRPTYERSPYSGFRSSGGSSRGGVSSGGSIRGGLSSGGGSTRGGLSGRR